MGPEWSPGHGRTSEAGGEPEKDENRRLMPPGAPSEGRQAGHALASDLKRFTHRSRSLDISLFRFARGRLSCDLVR